MITVRHLQKSFGSKVVLRGVNIHIKDGETAAIVGESGCGKSVLLKLLIGLLEADEGTITIDDTEITSANEHDIYAIRRHIGFLFQSAALFDSMTVKDNIILSLFESGIRDHNILNSTAQKAIAMVKLDGILEKKPSELSGGMKKRVGLARALASNPRYMFYDEPTTGLDPVTSDQIDDLIRDLTQTLNVTSLIVTHDLFTVKHIAQRVIFLNTGTVYFDGSSSEFLQSTDPVISRFVRRFSGT
jgi:phospholipid/cholesterol/gamma-HCH transport system ATP-binding protein